MQDINALIPDELNLIILISEHFQTIFWVLLLLVLVYMAKDYFFNCLLYSIRYLSGKEHDRNDKVMVIVEGIKFYVVIDRFSFWKSTVGMVVYDGPNYEQQIGYATTSQKYLTETFSLKMFKKSNI